MKKILLISLLTILALAGCKKQTGIIGTPRIFEVTPMTQEPWPGDITFNAVSYTWKVAAIGGKGLWTVNFETPPGDFTLEVNYDNNTFTVSAPENSGEETNKVTLKVSYNNDIWRYIDLRHIPNFINIDKGTEVEGGAIRYTIGADGLASFIGNIFVPGGEQVSVSYVDGDADVTESTYLISLVASSSPGMYNLSFSTKDLIEVIGWREARFKIEIDGRPDKTTIITLRQYGLSAPTHSTIDPTAPGGYFWRLKYNNLDVAGKDLETYNGEPVEGKTWNDIFDPQGTIPNVTSWSDVITSTVNPCPAGWRALTRDDALRMMGGVVAGVGGVDTGLPKNYSGKGGARNWELANGSVDIVNIFKTTANYYYIYGPTIGAHASTKQVARINVREGIDPLDITIAGRTTPFTQVGNTLYGIRCVRDSSSAQ